MNIQSNRSLHDMLPPTTLFRPISTIKMIWIIAMRQINEAVKARKTIILFLFSLALMAVMIQISLDSMIENSTSPESVGTFIAFYLSWVCLLNSHSAIGFAASVFAGEKEQGCLVPLLVTPASDIAIFVGKVLGAILPTLLYIVVGVLGYVLELILFFGIDVVRLVPLDLAGCVLFLAIGVTMFGVVLVSIISSRASTFQSAQTYGSLITAGLWMLFFVFIFTTASWGSWILALMVVGLFLFNFILLYLGARYWRREEVMAR